MVLNCAAYAWKTWTRVSMIRNIKRRNVQKCVHVCWSKSDGYIIKGLPVKWKDTQRSSFSIEPEVGVVIAKTTMQHQVNSTQVPIQKYQNKKALPVICTIQTFPNSLPISNKL